MISPKWVIQMQPWPLLPKSEADIVGLGCKGYWGRKLILKLASTQIEQARRYSLFLQGYPYKRYNLSRGKPI